MPKTLTEADTFTPNVVVPEGLDDMDDAADIVEGIAQAFANRTKHLTQHSAKIDVENTFTQSQHVQGGISATGTVSALTATIGDDLTVGDDALVGGDLTVVGNAAIPHVAGNVAVAGNLSVGGAATIPHVAGSVEIANDLDVGGGIDATGDVYTDESMVAKGEFEHSPAIVRSTYLSLFGGFGQATFSGDTGVNHVKFEDAGHVHVWPIRLPANALLKRVQLLISKAGSGEMQIRVYRRNGVVGSGLPTETVFGPTSETASGAWFRYVDVNESIDPSAREYYVHVTSGDPEDTVLEVHVDWTDAGPYPIGG